MEFHYAEVVFQKFLNKTCVLARINGAEVDALRKGYACSKT